MSLKAVAEASGAVWDREKSNPDKRDWWSCCPLHAEDTPSFHVVEGAGGRPDLFKCFGCGAAGSVVDFIMMRDGVRAVEALARLADGWNIPRPSDSEMRRRRAENTARIAADHDGARRSEDNAAWAEARRIGAVRLWQGCTTGPAAMLATYLAARGLSPARLVAYFGDWPGDIAYHPNLRHFLDRQNRKTEPPVHEGPAMVGRIGPAAEMIGVHRTWIAADGRARYGTAAGSLDGRKVAKKLLGKPGAMKGASILMGAPSPVAVLGEGIESALAAALILEPGGARAISGISRDWITPDAHGSIAWSPPAGTRRLVIAAEGDGRSGKPGRESPAELAQRLYSTAARHWRDQGLDVRLCVPDRAWDVSRDYADEAAERWGAAVCGGHDALGVCDA
ncbi:MAG: CHC2 zinc finger domain-containing protein [Pseudomonadota bacterium]